MDEYLFTLLAKLKADRLKLQKAARDREIEALDDYYSSARRSKAPSLSARRSDSQPELSAIVSAHGLRGWS